MFSLVRDVTAEVAADDTMPRWIVFLVELLFDVGSDVFLDVVFFHGLVGRVDSILLHLLAHISIFDHGFSFSHLENKNKRNRECIEK